MSNPDPATTDDLTWQYLAQAFATRREQLAGRLEQLAGNIRDVRVRESQATRLPDYPAAAARIISALLNGVANLPADALVSDAAAVDRALLYVTRPGRTPKGGEQA